MTRSRTAAMFEGRIIAMFIDEGMEMLLGLRLCDSHGLYPYVMYQTIRYNEFRQEHTGRMVRSVRELTTGELCGPENAWVLERLCSGLGEKSGDAVCRRIHERGGLLFLHTLDDGGEIIVWSESPIIHYAQPKQIYFWDVGLTYDRAYERTDSSPVFDFFQPWRTDSFPLRPHGSNNRLYGGVRILEAAQTGYTMRLTVEDNLHRSHRVVYKNWAWSAITAAMIGVSLTLVREIAPDELTGGGHEAAVRGYLEKHPGRRSDLNDFAESGYKILLHETDDPETEFLVIAGYIYMT